MFYYIHRFAPATPLGPPGTLFWPQAWISMLFLDIPRYASIFLAPHRISSPKHGF